MRGQLGGVRKSSSCPSLSSLDQQPASPRPAPHGAPMHRREGGGSLRHQRMVQGRRGGSQPLQALPGLEVMSFLPLATTVPAVEEAVEKAEGDLAKDFFFAKGLVPASECFELYGWADKAPDLHDSPHSSGGIASPGSSTAPAPAASEPDWDSEDTKRGLASCLASPFLYDDTNLGSEVANSVRSKAAQGQRALQTRYEREVRASVMRPVAEVPEEGGAVEDNLAGEARARSLAEDAQERGGRLNTTFAGHQATLRSRRRRQDLADLPELAALAASAPPTRGGLPEPEPEIRRLLNRALSSFEDTSNRLKLDAEALQPRHEGAAGLQTLDPPDDMVFSLDPPPGYEDTGHHDLQAFDEGDFLTAPADSAMPPCLEDKPEPRPRSPAPTAPPLGEAPSQAAASPAKKPNLQGNAVPFKRRAVAEQQH